MMKEAVLGLRGGDGLTNVVAVIAFVIFMNWYDSLFSVEALQANPLPHQDPFGWLSGKYNSKNVGPSGSRPTIFRDGKTYFNAAARVFWYDKIGKTTVT